MTTPEFQDAPPLSERVSAYDERHLVTYLRLLDAAQENAPWQEVTAIIFGIDASLEPERAKAIHDSHLARARWMTEVGYRDLLTKK